MLSKKPHSEYSYVNADYQKLNDGKLTFIYWYDENSKDTWNDVVIHKTGEHHHVVSYLKGLALTIISAIFGIYLSTHWLSLKLKIW